MAVRHWAAVGLISGAFWAPVVMAVDKNLFAYGEVGRLDVFDPYTIHEASGQRLSELLFDSLIDVGPGGQYAPALAKSWRVEKGNTKVIFDLRSDVIWNAGSGDTLEKPFSAQDVVTTVRLIIAKESEFPNRERFFVIAGAEAIGPNQVAISLNRAMPDPLRAMMFKIMPNHVVGAATAIKRDSAFAKNPVGTGPYKFAGANAQGEVLLVANEKYFKGAPKIKKMVMKSFADQSVMAQSLMFNSLDLITYVSPRDLGEILGDARLSAVPYDALSFSFFGLNTQRNVLSDKRVRQAIGLAINRDEMLKAFFGGNGRIISGPFPPTSWAYNLDVKPTTYDLGRAKTLLQAAGLKDNDGDGTLEDINGKPFTFNVVVPIAGESEMIKRIVLAFQGYMAKVGLRTELQFLDWVVWKGKVLRDHNYDITIASWSFDDATNITSLFHSSSAQAWGNNFVMFQNSEVDSLLTEADATSDFDKRRAIYHKLHAILADEAPYTYLWTLVHHAAFNNQMSGIRIEPTAFFKHVTSWNREIEVNGRKP